jgi:hypothetical protein
MRALRSQVNGTGVSRRFDGRLAQLPSGAIRPKLPTSGTARSFAPFCGSARSRILLAMRTALLAACCALLSVSLAPAQNDADEVLKTEKALHEAKIHSDVAALDRILADDFIEINQWGVVRDKRSILDLYRTLKVTSLNTSDESVRVTGDTATVIGIMSTSSVTGMGRFLFIQTYVKRGGRWQVLSIAHVFHVNPDTMHTEDPGGPEAVRPPRSRLQ